MNKYVDELWFYQSESAPGWHAWSRSGYKKNHFMKHTHRYMPSCTHTHTHTSLRSFNLVQVWLGHYPSLLQPILFPPILYCDTWVKKQQQHCLREVNVSRILTFKWVKSRGLSGETLFDSSQVHWTRHSKLKRIYLINIQHLCSVDRQSSLWRYVVDRTYTTYWGSVSLVYMLRRFKNILRNFHCLLPKISVLLVLGAYSQG